MVSIGWFDGPRAALDALFREADDADAAIAAYRDTGRVLVARLGDGARDGEAGEPVGHLLLTPLAGGDALEVKSLAAHPDHRGMGIGRQLLERAAAVAREEGRRRLLVATATADVGVLRFYQRAGYRLLRIERDVFTRANGYPETLVDGIPLRDQVWLSLDL